VNTQRTKQNWRPAEVHLNHSLDRLQIVPSDLENQMQDLDTTDAPAPLDTDWSRILYCDLFTARTDDCARDARESDPRGSWAWRASAKIGLCARRVLAGLRQWRRFTRFHDALRQLDDRTLRDIGLHRSEILSAAVAMTAASRTQFCETRPSQNPPTRDGIAPSNAGLRKCFGSAAVPQSH
jgi:uncharacterized protein YjiS (DUF1127 family)